jgi:hypothetical protein
MFMTSLSVVLPSMMRSSAESVADVAVNVSLPAVPLKVSSSVVSVKVRDQSRP